MSNDNEEQIRLWAERIRQSDRDYFENLFRLLYPQLVQFAIRYTRQKDTACDIVQDVFIALWENRANIDPEKSLKAYMFKAVRNQSINWTNSRANQTGLINQYSLTEEADETSTHDKLVTNIKTWITELPERQREAFELSRFDGLDHPEIAAVMNISPKTVNNHIVSALQFLRDKYDLYQQDNSRIEDDR